MLNRGSMRDISTNLFFASHWIPAAKSVPIRDQKVMIVLHGRGDSIDAFTSIKGELRLAGFNFLLLNAPWKFGSGYSWGALEPKPGGRMDEVRARLFGLVDLLLAQGWAASDIFWLGHSQGCLVATDLVLHHPLAFGGLVGVSGYVRFPRGWKKRLANSGARHTPCLFTHGTRDRVILPEEIRADVVELASGFVPVHYREFPKGHDFDHAREVPFIRKWVREQSLAH